MANLLKNKWIGSNEVTGRNILIENAEFIRAKKADGTVQNIFRLAADNRLVFEAPIILTSAAAQSDDALALQTRGQVDTLISVETDARTASETAIGTRIDGVEAAATLDANRLTQEISDRVVQGNNLSTAIDTERTRAEGEEDRIEGLVTDEAAARAAADTALGGRIDQEISDRNTAIGVETSRAQSAESSLGQAISDETAARTQGDADTLASANAYTDTRIDAVMGGIAPETLDTIKEIGDALASEQTATGSILTQLGDHGTRITALEEVQAPVWASPFKKVLTDTDISNKYIDLPHLAVDNSVFVSVDRLSLYEGAAEDFTVSEVGGVTRITFVNGMIPPSAQALVGGSTPDNVYVKYQYVPAV